jgi:glyoxylase-like metal-dependent hydrolase (beta-lactamase superfamily II)
MFFLFLPLYCVANDLFDIKPVAEGVYAAIAKPAFKINCNAAIILLDDGVLVVDTHSKPSAARALIEQIKKLTPKPVRFVVKTHFHWDHYQGNEAYPSSWPAGVEIISSEATRTSIEQRGIPRVKHEIATMPAAIEQLESGPAKGLDSRTENFHPERRFRRRGISLRAQEYANHSANHDLRPEPHPSPQIAHG